MIWLTGQLAPDLMAGRCVKTAASSSRWRKLDLLSAASVAINGSKLNLCLVSVRRGYASAAKDGGSHITIVMGDVALLHHVMEAIGAAGRGHVTLDFVGSP
jgi:hypothetical protein